MPVQQRAVRLDGGGHAGRHIVAAEQAADFVADARPGRSRELAQQAAVEAGMQPQALGDGQDHLPVRRRANRPLRRRASLSSSARFWWHEGQVQRCLQEKATNISCWQSPQRTRAKPWLQIAALQIGRHAPLDDRPPEAVLGLIPLVVDLLEGREMAVHHAPQVRGLRVAWAVERRGLDRRHHDRKREQPGIVYRQPLSGRNACCQPQAVPHACNCRRQHRLRREKHAATAF